MVPHPHFPVGSPPCGAARNPNLGARNANLLLLRGWTPARHLLTRRCAQARRFVELSAAAVRGFPRLGGSGGAGASVSAGEEPAELGVEAIDEGTVSSDSPEHLEARLVMTELARALVP